MGKSDLKLKEDLKRSLRSKEFWIGFVVVFMLFAVWKNHYPQPNSHSETTVKSPVKVEAKEVITPTPSVAPASADEIELLPPPTETPVPTIVQPQQEDTHDTDRKHSRKRH